MFKAILFDAVGTLFHLSKTVGYHYALVGSRMGLELNVSGLDRAFSTSWKKMPFRPAIAGPRDDDDKDWWRQLVNQVLDEVAPETSELDRDAFFEAAYSHFAEAGVWELFPEVIEVLEALHSKYQLCVLSNFDGRLRMILEQFGISRYFAHVFLSSELGAEKPDPIIFQRALKLGGVAATEALHVGDDPIRDWKGARSAALAVFELERENNSLRDVLKIL